jgi:hypothetical protein
MGDVPVATNGDVKNSQVEQEATVPETKKGTTRGSGAKRGGGTTRREAVVCQEAEAAEDGWQEATLQQVGADKRRESEDKDSPKIGGDNGIKY